MVTLLQISGTEDQALEGAVEHLEDSEDALSSCYSGFAPPPPLGLLASSGCGDVRSFPSSAACVACHTSAARQRSRSGDEATGGDGATKRRALRAELHPSPGRWS